MTESPYPRVGVPEHLMAELSIAEQTSWINDLLVRRPVSRRAALKGAVTGAAALTIASSPWGRLAGRAFAAPGVMVIGRRLSFGADPTTQMALAGELTGALPAGAKLFADLGLDTGYGTAVPVEVRRLVSQVPQADLVIVGSEQFFAHAMLAGLTPGTTYHWRFRYVDASGEAVTPDSTLATAPARGTVAAPFTFTSLGDHGFDQPAADAEGNRRGAPFTNNYDAGDTRRSANPATSLTRLIAAEKENAFHLLTGDICYADSVGIGEPAVPNGGNPQTYQNYNPFAWTTYFQQIQMSAARVPWMFTTGNHDQEVLYGTPQSGPPLAQVNEHGYGGHAVRLDLPKNGPAVCPSVYSFVYGNVGVISLDANDLSQELPGNLGYSMGAQVRWLEQRLIDLRKDLTVDWIVCFFHHCAYSTSETHSSDQGVRNALAPLFQKYSVDLVLQGHNHQFERTNPIKDDKSTRQAPDGSTIYPAVDGTTYVLTGSGGRPRYGFQPGSKERYRGDGIDDSQPGAGPEAESTIFFGPQAKRPETVDWSQVRYDNYAYLAVDVVPAAPGERTTMTLRTVTDLGVEIDRLTMVRNAGEVPPFEVPEVPTALMLPAAGLLVGGAVLAARRFGADGADGAAPV